MQPRYGNHNSANVSLCNGQMPECRNEYYQYYKALMDRKTKDGTAYTNGTWCKLPVGQTAWAVYNTAGDIVDLYTHEITPENIVLSGDEHIEEVIVTRKGRPEKGVNSG